MTAIQKMVQKLLRPQAFEKWAVYGLLPKKYRMSQSHESYVKNKCVKKIIS